MTQCILVVDDDVDVRDFLCRMLESDGYRVVAATGGREALERMAGGGAAAFSPDLVITDLVMPGMDGLALLQRLIRAVPGVCALAMSGGGRSAPDMLREAARLLGPRSVVRKPFTRDEMLMAVRQALRPEAGKNNKQREAADAR